MSNTIMTLHSSIVGEGQAVILLHGLFGVGANLKGIANALAPYFQVHSLDLRNHGKSPWSDEMSYPLMAADVADYINQRELGLCHVVGHSMGGKVAMELALSNPPLVERLVIADISPVAYFGNHDDVFAGLAAVDLAHIRHRRDVDEKLAGSIKEAEIRQFLLRNLYRDDQGQFQWAMNIEALKHNYARIRECIDAERAFLRPTLFIKGEKSRYIMPEHKTQILTLFPQASLKVIQNAGHWLHAEKPAVFNQLVVKFLTALKE